MSNHEGHGFVAVLPKPYLPETVVEVMQRLLYGCSRATEYS